MEDQQYIVSARKYRPASFRTVVGQEALTTTLKNAIATNHLAHAYLFCGPRGVGKTTCARIFAKTINCEHPTAEGEACNECESCRSFNEQRSFNILELDAASKNSVEDIRELIKEVNIPPHMGRYKVYIIDEVHMLTTQAFNAFLKTLEEPPAHAVFILATTEKHKIIPTILSRCQIYDFKRISVNDVVNHLQYVANNEGVTAEIEALNVIAQKADGAMRDALSIFDQVVSFCGGNITYKGTIENLNVLDYDYYFHLVDDFLEGQINDALLTFNDILCKGFEAQYFVTGLASHFRDLLVCRDEATKVLLEVGASIADQYVAQAKKCPVAFLYRAIELTNECDLNYRASRNKRLSVELLLIKLCQLTGKQPTMPAPEATTIKPIVATPVQPQTVQPAAAQSQPQVAQNQPVAQPAQTAAPARPAATPTSAAPTKKMNSFSISGTNATAATAATEVPATPTVQAEVKQRNAFTDEQFAEAWTAAANALHDDAHAANTMLNFKPQRNADEQFQVKVFNTLQQKDFDKYKSQILSSLRTNLKNDFIDFSVIVDDTPTENLAFTPEEKFAKMRQKNENLNNMTQQLGLDI